MDGEWVLRRHLVKMYKFTEVRAVRAPRGHLVYCSQFVNEDVKARGIKWLVTRYMVH